MKINIGNNNKIKNTIIGNNNNASKKNNKVFKIILDIIIGIIIALVSAYIIYKLGWNKKRTKNSRFF